ncbi:MAG TPA: hypothetical protein VJ691_15600 [Vicinamibacterales bacterium]|nr:hypothetical protein [Vicinamibacterales bacterium]
MQAGDDLTRARRVECGAVVDDAFEIRSAAANADESGNARESPQPVGALPQSDQWSSRAALLDLVDQI